MRKLALWMCGPLLLGGCSWFTLPGTRKLPKPIPPVAPTATGPASEIPLPSTAPAVGGGQLIQRSQMPPLEPITPGPGAFSESYQPAPAKAAPYRVLPAASALVNRDGRVVHGPGPDMWLFEPAKGQGNEPPLMPMELLPGPYLAQIIQLARANEPNGARFDLSGEVTLYHGRNYLIVTQASLIVPGSPATQSQPASGPATQAASQPAQTQPAGQRLSAEQLARKMLAAQREKPLLPSVDHEPIVQPPSAAPRSLIKPLPTPDRLVLRAGRLAKGPASQWWTYHFEAQGDVLREAPVRVLPNQQLEQMAQASDGGARPGAVFQVSGPVLKYQGHGYLLVRAWRFRPDLGQI